jgi:hypothetical protein
VSRNFLQHCAFLVLAVGLTACGQNYNSSSNDGGGDLGIDCTVQAQLCSAYTAMKTNHCFECHSWSGYRTNQDWLNSGLVIKDNPSGSRLITQLKNAGGTMPQNNSPMASDDYDAITAWIRNM